MPLLRKTGVRSPWLPAPLDAAIVPSADALRQTIVIGALVPAILLGNVTAFVGRPAPPENVNWPARPAVEQQGPVPVPGAFVWAPSPARLPNTDPLRPLIVVADAPDGALVQSAALWVSRLSRAEDVNWPARALTEQQGPIPIPGAVAISLYAPRDAPAAPADRLAFTQVISGGAPIPDGRTLFVGAVHQAPADRLAQTTVIGALVPAPSAVSIATYAPRDFVTAPSDRLAFTQVVQPPPVPPGAIAQAVGAVHPTPTERVPTATRASGPPVPIPGASAQSVGVAHDGDRLPLSAAVQGPSVPIPGAVAVRVGRFTATPTDPIRPLAVIVNQPPISGARIAATLALKPVYIITPTDATRIAIVALEIRGGVVAADVRAAAVAEVRRAIVAAEARIVIVIFDDRDGTP
jgi:hypothetical protein